MPAQVDQFDSGACRRVCSLRDSLRRACKSDYRAMVIGIGIHVQYVRMLRDRGSEALHYQWIAPLGEVRHTLDQQSPSPCRMRPDFIMVCTKFTPGARGSSR